MITRNIFFILSISLLSAVKATEVKVSEHAVEASENNNTKRCKNAPKDYTGNDSVTIVISNQGIFEVKTLVRISGKKITIKRRQKEQTENVLTKSDDVKQRLAMSLNKNSSVHYSPSWKTNHTAPHTTNNLQKRSNRYVPTFAK